MYLIGPGYCPTPYGQKKNGVYLKKHKYKTQNFRGKCRPTKRDRNLQN